MSSEGENEDSKLFGMKSGDSGAMSVEMDEIAVNAERDKLMFPKDLQNEQFYPEAIRFTIYERYGKGLEEIETAFNKTFDEEVTLQNKIKILDDVIDAGPAKAKLSVLEGQDAINGALAAKRELPDRNILQSAARVGGALLDAGQTVLKDKQAFRQGRIDGGAAQIKRSIYLQMPESVIFNEQVDWTGTDLGVVGAMLKGEGLTGAGVAAGIGNAGKVVGGSLGALAGMLPGLSGPASAVVGALLGGESGLAGGIESTLSMKANPFKEQTFQGVPFRPFEFQFAFRARSADEVKEVAKIIQAFRSYSKPSFKAGGSTVFKYPHEFRIEFLRLVNDNYETNLNLPQIKYCICKTVNTNYTGQGWKSFDGGAPVDINLTLSFEETEIVTQEDVDGKTSVGDFAKRGYNF